ncbi:putative Uncharacterized membrane protein YjcL [Nannochloris sp. 'desiccata']|nr:putative Uncharacterized membrane protein YjcL [Chlorella desiccata (nom. nud.)]
MSAVRVQIAESLIGCQKRRPISTQGPLFILDQGKHFPSIEKSREVVKLRMNQRRRPKARVTATIATAAIPSPVSFSTGWALWACIAACAAVSQVIERRTRIGVFLSAPLLSTFLALLAAALNIIPTTAPAYDTIWTYLMPIAAALYLLESDISKLITSAGQSIIAFLNGALGSVIGTLVAFALVGRYLGPDGSKVAAALCASYIGGSVNFAAVSGLLGLTAGSTLAAAMVSDNLAMAAYIAVLMSIPAQLPASLLNLSTDKDNEEGNSSNKVTSESVGLALAAAVVACGAGNALSTWVGFSSGGLAFTALIASGIATLAGYLHRRVIKRTNPRGNEGSGRFSGFNGAEAIGGALMMFFFATIGAAAGSFSALRGSGWLLVFIAIQLSIQLGVSLILGIFMKIPLPLILIASNANVGGPATAAAMAGAKGWTSLIQPAVLTGALGYAIANGIGLAIGTWLAT